MANYALIKNMKVVTLIVANPSAMSPEFISALKSELSIDEVVLADDTPAIPGADYNGTEFIPPQPYLSWTWNSPLKKWEPPIPIPTDDIGAGNMHQWNENAQSWDVVTPLTT